jgi:hypothetical protein
MQALTSQLTAAAGAAKNTLRRSVENTIKQTRDMGIPPKQRKATSQANKGFAVGEDTHMGNLPYRVTHMDDVASPLWRG